MDSKWSVINWWMILIGVIMNTAGVYVVKFKMNAVGAMQLDSLRNILGYFSTLVKSPMALFGGILILAAPIPYAVAVSRMQLSIVYPVSVGLSYLIILPLSVLYLGESVTANKIVGFILILVSLYLFHK